MMHIVPKIFLNGPLSDQQMRDKVFRHFVSPHQWAAINVHEVLFISHEGGMVLDRSAMNDLADYLKANHPFFEHRQLIEGLRDKIVPRPKVEPKPEPEVAAKLVTTVAKPAPTPQRKRWKARVSTKAFGQDSKDTYYIDDMAELDRIIENGPDFDDLKHIKIRLEYLL